MKIGNKGLTLVELVVCMVIFGFLASAAYGFMLAGANSFSSVNSGINLQTSSSLTMNQLSAYLIDCRTGICFTDNKLYVINEDPEPNADGSAAYTANIFEFKNDSCIYFSSTAAFKTDSRTFSCDYTSGDLLAEHVQDDLTIKIIPHEDGTSAVSVEIKASFADGKQSITKNKIVFLRNKPEIVFIS